MLMTLEEVREIERCHGAKIGCRYCMDQSPGKSERYPVGIVAAHDLAAELRQYEENKRK